MKSIFETLRGARHLELFILMLLLSALGLLLLNGSGANPGRSSDEIRLERLLERIDGVGDAAVMIALDGDGKPVGAAVVAEGLTDVRARLEVQSAIQALLDIDIDRIRVIGRGGVSG